MQYLYYAIQNIFRGRDATLVKVVSLTLGLFLSILLFARIAFELSYDYFYADADRLYLVQTAWQTEKGMGEASRYNIHPTAEVIARHFPDEVESFTTLSPFGPSYLKHGQQQVKATTIRADSLYFQTLGLPLREGNAFDLAMPDAIFLSESFARQLFGSEHPMGKTLTCPTRNQERPLVVRGIYADFPHNTELVRPDAILSFSSLLEGDIRLGWTSGGNYEAYIRLRRAASADVINARLNSLIANYFPNDHYGQYGTAGIEVSILPLSDLHLSNANVRKMLQILSALGFVLLFTATLNYALIAISSLSRRAKAVGVHKCSGAGAGSIWAMFLWETALLIGVVLLLVTFLILNFRTQIEDMMGLPLVHLFSWSNLWAPLVAVGFLFVVGGLLPGRVFATIPVTQVFRHYTEGKKRWKYPLLFLQFGSAAFLTGLLCVVFMQYRYTLTKELGYRTEGIAYTYAAFPQPENAQRVLRNLPYVTDVSSANSDMSWAPNPFGVNDASGQYLFSPRANWFTPDFFSFIGLRLHAGRFPTTQQEILVNPAYVRRMGWEGTGIGEVVPEHGTVTGLIEGYSFIDTTEMEPFEVRLWGEPVAGCMHVQLKEPVDENLRRLNADMKRIYPQEKIEFTSYANNLKRLFHSKRVFRDTTLLATLAILAITLMGLIGYTNDEVRRRSKEIAIRKIHGSEVSGILRLLSKDVLWVALPAVAIGTVGAIYAGELWQSQFDDVWKMPWELYGVCALMVLAFIVATVIVRAWRIANANPVESIQSE